MQTQGECELCVKSGGGGGAYDFKNFCCRVRLLTNLKVKENVSAWLKVWRKKDGDQVADQIKQEYCKRVESRK